LHAENQSQTGKLVIVTLRDPSTRQLDLTFEESPARRIWLVHDLVARVREHVEQRYADLWVEGEISNFRPAPSGHIYFSLKDADAQLPVVLFRKQALLLRFRPEDGLHVLVRGRISVYEQRGQLQLVAETMEPVGAGSLQLAFEQLKEKLKAEGLFDLERKRPLPAFPRTVGIVTSPAGAVIRDFLNIVGRRHSGLNVIVCRVSVQGESAAAEIESAIARLNACGLADLVVLARGGGSLEDLAAFNSERVARAIRASRLPVVSAIGHETDFTIADFAADLRAPTPSAAAELITEAQHKVADRVSMQASRLERAARFQLLMARQRVDRLRVDRAQTRMTSLLHRSEQQLDDLAYRFEASFREQLRKRRARADELSAHLLRQDPRRLLAQIRERFAAARARLERLPERMLHVSSMRLEAIEARLHALSPLEVLQRGYALVQDGNGVLIRSSAQLAVGDQVTTRLSNSSFTSRVESREGASLSKNGSAQDF
jgi:exodeoxyribonuclease VII large subunit